MGMDVYGLEPTSEKGEYFRNNVWWWHPLWNYCCHIAPDITDEVEGHTNSGDGLDAESARELAVRLFIALASGETKEYEEEYRKEVAALPRETCVLCGGTGIRKDEVGIKMGMHDKKLDEARQALYGREFGWCNGCDGHGSTENWHTNYPFSVENVQEFAEFVRDSGGFGIH